MLSIQSYVRDEVFWKLHRSHPQRVGNAVTKCASHRGRRLRRERGCDEKVARPAANSAVRPAGDGVRRGDDIATGSVEEHLLHPLAVAQLPRDLRREVAIVQRLDPVVGRKKVSW